MEIDRHCVCAHVRKASRALTVFYDRFIAPSGIRVTQLSLLMNIRRLEYATITRLSETMLMDKTTLTRNVRVLEKKGLIRIQAGEDQRVKRIEPTDVGIEVMTKARALWFEAQKDIVEKMGKSRMDRMIEDLTALAEIAGE